MRTSDLEPVVRKVGIVGVGAVGQACAFSLLLRGSCGEIVLVDKAGERATAVAADMRYGAGVPLAPTVEIVGGGWADLAGTSVVLICAGVNEREVRFANIAIIEGNDASQFGIGVACARITEAVLGDERVVMPVAAYRDRYGATIGLPTVVGREGAVGELEPSMSEAERRAFERSAETLRDASRSIPAGVRPRGQRIHQPPRPTRLTRAR